MGIHQAHATAEILEIRVNFNEKFHMQHQFIVREADHVMQRRDDSPVRIGPINKDVEIVSTQILAV